MKFPKTTFSVDVSIEPKGANPKQVEVTITEGDISDEMVIASAIAGNSPRVRFQSQVRRDGFPTGMKVEMSPAEWFGSPRARTTRELSPEELQAAAIKRAKEDGGYRAKMIADLMALDKSDEG